jgi:probable F420-dependent oxidoreductase
MDAPRTRPVKVGLLLATGDHWDGSTATWSEILASAQLAEAIGFDSVWVVDHLLMQFPPVPSIGIWDGWSMLAAIAATTSRVELGPLVSCTAYRNPALLAKMAATVDEISGGRLILGLGAGWHEPEFRAFGYPFDHRVGRFEEALTIISTLLRTGEIDFDGRYYQARACEHRPRGPRPDGIPIMVGCSGDRMLGLTARHADIWSRDFIPAGSLGELREVQAKVDAVCRDADRVPETLDRYAAVAIDLPGSTRPDGFGALSGSPEQLADSLRDYAAAGFSHIQLWLEPANPAAIEAFATTLEFLDQA